MARSIVKRRQSGARGSSRLRLVVAFIAGMGITAALAQAPFTADIFSRRVIQETVVPASPDGRDSWQPTVRPDTSHPAKRYRNELVYTVTEEAINQLERAIPCGKASQLTLRRAMLM